MSDGEFAGKVVLVTGAASGLGRAASIRFASEGGRVCLVDINADGLAETARRIEEAGGECASMAGDLGNPAVCAQAVATAVDAFGRLDVLCNVAGILRFHALEDVTTQDWNKLLAANVSGPFFMMQAAMPHLVESHGNIVNVVSTAAFLGYLLHGVPGAAIASAGIFLPSFIFVVLLAKILWRLRASQRMGNFLDAVNASSVGLMAAVTVTLAQNTLFQWQSAVLAVLAMVLLVVLKWSPLWLIPSSSVAGWLLFQL